MWLWWVTSVEDNYLDGGPPDQWLQHIRHHHRHSLWLYKWWSMLVLITKNGSDRWSIKIQVSFSFSMAIEARSSPLCWIMLSGQPIQLDSLMPREIIKKTYPTVVTHIYARWWPSFPHILAPGRCGCYHKLVIFKLISRIDISWAFSMKLSQVFTNNQSILAQIMAWCCQATSHYRSQCWPRSMSPYYITRLQWGNKPARYGLVIIKMDIEDALGSTDGSSTKTLWRSISLTILPSLVYLNSSVSDNIYSWRFLYEMLFKVNTTQIIHGFMIIIGCACYYTLSSSSSVLSLWVLSKRIKSSIFTIWTFNRDVICVSLIFLMSSNTCANFAYTFMSMKRVCLVSQK